MTCLTAAALHENVIRVVRVCIVSNTIILLHGVCTSHSHTPHSRARSVVKRLVLGLVHVLVVEVDEGAFHLLELLEFYLQRLADVVRLAEGHVLRENDVHLHDVLGSQVERPHRVDRDDCW